MLTHHRDSKAKGACWLDQRLSLSPTLQLPSSAKGSSELETSDPL